TEVRRALTDPFACHTIESYGISEASSAAAATPADRPGKPASVGQPIWGTAVLIADDDGKPCPTGERGEILARGVGVMTGYHNLP
ncbi:AMP-binding protein, partial [Streptomyces sp. GbtcB7]|uniref:AMP-binding protein n=1 Tax=Streptomyces sp. GbtcB7 TaxID=2824752 RepID=UPI001C308E91